MEEFSAVAPGVDCPGLFVFWGKRYALPEYAQDEKAVFEYLSDPAKPVPYTSQTEGLTFTPRRFMSDDQRQASRRPDVLTFVTLPLTTLKRLQEKSWQN